MTSMNFKCLCGWSWHHNCPVTWPTVPTSATQPDRTELHHLLNRAIDGVALHGESDRLRDLVRGLEKRAEQAEAAIARAKVVLVDPLLHTTDPERQGERYLARSIRDALDQPQQPTTTEADHA